MFLSSAALGQTPRSPLHFPLADLTPYTDEIITVLDHLGTGFGKSHADGDVLAYTGESASGTCPKDKLCGYPNSHFT